MEFHSMLCASLDGRGAWGRMDTCICIAKSFFCSPETVTTLLIGYFSSVTQSCLPLCDPMDCSTPGLLSITNSRSLLKLMFNESVMPSNHGYSPLFPHLFAMKWWDQMPWSLFSECWVLSQLFHSLLSLSSGGSLVLLIFLPKGSVIYISEVINISPSNLDSSLYFV